eukprot:jgi/Mesvir1/214/Mv13558-RA.1
MCAVARSCRGLRGLTCRNAGMITEKTVVAVAGHIICRQLRGLRLVDVQGCDVNGLKRPRGLASGDIISSLPLAGAPHGTRRPLKFWIQKNGGGDPHALIQLSGL